MPWALPLEIAIVASTTLIFAGTIPSTIQFFKGLTAVQLEKDIAQLSEKLVEAKTHVDITYLLSLCKQDDLHLRGACVNITCYINLNKIHFLTLSSLSNSFINQCSLISTESQDNSRLGILADLLSTF
ncbi:unnamed protein product [Rotaria sp. Silwood1]|nr:unnamed protein product [Rotaria sp. Silwood1]